MPKWFKIGLVLILSAFALPFVAGLFYRPDSIRYHAKAYTEERRWSNWENWVAAKAPNWAVHLVADRKSSRVEAHQKALIRLGFLQESTVVVSNAIGPDVMIKVLRDNPKASNPRGVDWEFFSFTTRGPNVIRLVCKRRDVEIWEELIREADVPEAKFEFPGKRTL